jgi:hypothetical protein
MPAATRDIGLASDGMIALRHKGLGHGADPDTLVQRDETGSFQRTWMVRNRS